MQETRIGERTYELTGLNRLTSFWLSFIFSCITFMFFVLCSDNDFTVSSKNQQISKINKWHLPKLQKQCKKIELQTPKSLLYTYKRLFCWRRSTKEHSCYLHCLFWHIQAQLKSHFCKSRQKCHVVPLWQKHHKTFHHSKRTV